MKQLLSGTFYLLLFIPCGQNQQQVAQKQSAVLAGAKDSAAPVLLASANPYAPIDLSPMDVAYFPADYPIAKMAKPDLEPPKARIIYSRPHKQGRPIFGSLLKYGEVWRLGANEATEIELFQDAAIQNKKVARGRYVLYSIPQADTWTIIFNSNVYSWGLKQDPAQEKYRFVIPVEQTTIPIEFYTMAFQKTETGADLLMAWDNVVAKLPIPF